MGDPSSGLLHCGQYHTSPPVLTAMAGGSLTGKVPWPSEMGVDCRRGNDPGSNGNSSLGSVNGGMLEPLFLEDLAEL